VGDSAATVGRNLSLLRHASGLVARAEDASAPLVDRLHALHHSGQALDDVFRLEVPRLKEQVDWGVGSAEGLRLSARSLEIRREVDELYRRQSRLFHRDLIERLAVARIALVDAVSLSKADGAYLARHFEERVLPLLTPLAVDPGRPFLPASQLSLSLAVIVRYPLDHREHFASLTVPDLLPRLVALRDGERFLPVEQLVASNLRVLFPGMEIVSHAVFRLTHDDGIEVARDRPGGRLGRHGRRVRPVRLEINPQMSEEVRDLLVRQLLLTPDDVYVVGCPLDPGWAQLVGELDRPEHESVA
jgi:polyphosphate kinase